MGLYIVECLYIITRWSSSCCLSFLGKGTLPTTTKILDRKDPVSMKIMFVSRMAQTLQGFKYEQNLGALMLCLLPWCSVCESLCVVQRYYYWIFPLHPVPCLSSWGGHVTVTRMWVWPSDVSSFQARSNQIIPGYDNMENQVKLEVFWLPALVFPTSGSLHSGVTRQRSLRIVILGFENSTWRSCGPDINWPDHGGDPRRLYAG